MLVDIGRDEAADGDLRTDHDERCDRGEVEQRPNVDRVHAGADQRSGDRADAERGMEARHDRPIELLLDRTSLDVHGDVPLAGAEPEHEQPSADHHGSDLGADGDDRKACHRHHRHDRDRAGGTESVHDEPGRGQRQQ